MHVARQTDGLQPRQLRRVHPRQLGDHRLAGPDPILWSLFGPSRLWPGDGQRRMRHADDSEVPVDQHRFDAGRSNVEFQVHLTAPFRR